VQVTEPEPLDFALLESVIASKLAIVDIPLSRATT
jgi:hypothetical protein